MAHFTDEDIFNSDISIVMHIDSSDVLDLKAINKHYDESTWVGIKIEGTIMICGSLYRHPHCSNSLFFEFLSPNSRLWVVFIYELMSS